MKNGGNFENNEIIEERNKKIDFENIKFRKIVKKSNKNADFRRRTTNEGNFEKGFSVYLLDKKGEKIYYRISTNTINAAKYPIISIYKAKKPINLSDDYSKANLWEEEI